MPANPMEIRMARLEGAYDQVSQRLMTIDPRFDGVDRKIDLRFDALDKKVEALATESLLRFHAVDQRFDAVDQRFDAVDQRFDAIDKRFEAVDKRFDALDAKNDKRFDALESKIDQRFMWLIGLVLTTWVTAIVTPFFHH